LDEHEAVKTKIPAKIKKLDVFSIDITPI